MANYMLKKFECGKRFLRKLSWWPRKGRTAKPGNARESPNVVSSHGKITVGQEHEGMMKPKMIMHASSMDGKESGNSTKHRIWKKTKQAKGEVVYVFRATMINREWSRSGGGREC